MLELPFCGPQPIIFLLIVFNFWKNFHVIVCFYWSWLPDSLPCSKQILFYEVFSMSFISEIFMLLILWNMSVYILSSSVILFSSCPQSFPQGKPNCGVSCFERSYDLGPINQSSHGKAVENKPVEYIPSFYSSPPLQCFGDVLYLLSSLEGKGDCWGG